MGRMCCCGTVRSEARALAMPCGPNLRLKFQNLKTGIGGECERGEGKEEEEEGGGGGAEWSGEGAWWVRGLNTGAPLRPRPPRFGHLPRWVGTGGGCMSSLLADFHRNDGLVVVRPRPAAMAFDGVGDRFAERFRPAVGAQDDRFEGGGPELASCGVHGFGDAVGEEHQRLPPARA